LLIGNMMNMRIHHGILRDTWFGDGSKMKYAWQK
jgi:hypothetical protein